MHMPLLFCRFWYINILIYCGRPGGIPARNSRGERLLLFIGIIDILQSYRLKKKLEHTWKAMIHDGVCSVSFMLLYMVLTAAENKIIWYLHVYIYIHVYIFTVSRRKLARLHVPSLLI